jgi:hypothetical protein
MNQLTQSRLGPAALSVGAAVFLTTQMANAGIPVNDGQLLTEEALNNGVFEGQSFVLEPGTMFDINGGGGIGPVDGGPGTSEGFYEFNGSTVNVHGGGRFHSTILTPSRARSLTVNVYEGGSVGSKFVAGTDTTINILGGHLGSFVNALSGSAVNLVGGSIGVDFKAYPGITVNISGGSVERMYSASFETVTNISGGEIGSQFGVGSGSITNLFVFSLSIDGVAVDLSDGEEFLIESREGSKLVATLADGSLFDLNLNNNTVLGDDFVSSGARLTAMLMGCNIADIAAPRGVLDIADVTRYVDAFVGNEQLADVAAPFDILDLDDLVAFVQSFLDGC